MAVGAAPPLTRPACAADLPALAPLFDAYRQFYGRRPDPMLAQQYLAARLAAGESVILLAEDASGAACGFTQLYPGFCSLAAAPIAVLYDLYVAPAQRRRGAGRALLLAAEAHARTQGLARLELSTARDNRAAQALYESLGWVRDEHFFVYGRRLND